ncbi:MAG TPA: fumarate hydratase [Methanomicrobia archaeon]|nr:fumarate hydratase [Methanomicrobia archaeon]
MKRVITPVDAGEVKRLRVGDIVQLSGEVYTARDRAHERIIALARRGADAEIPIPRGAILYHCGPVVRLRGGVWEIIAAGPTTSTRMEAFTPEVVEQLQIRGLIGKGGMGSATKAALARYGCVYFALTGGAAVLAATQVKEVEAVYWEDLGLAEAVWQLRVEDFGPLVVSMDAHGNSLYEEIAEAARRNLRAGTAPSSG